MPETTSIQTVEITEPTYGKLLFTISSHTQLFQTHKSEDVNIIENRATLLEIHELLMQVNLKILPLNKFFRKFWIFFKINLLLSFIMTFLLFILAPRTVLLAGIIASFTVLQLWVLITPFVRKSAYKGAIKEVIRDREEFYSARGLKWDIKTPCFLAFSGAPCWLELGIEEHSYTGHNDEEEEKEPISAGIKAAENGQYTFVKKGKTGHNLTLGPQISNGSFHGNGLYTVVEVLPEMTINTTIESYRR